MHKVYKIVDFSCWTGNWPFIELRHRNLDSLQEKLESLNIVKAFVAPIEGILEQDPMRANRKLLDDISSDFFSPVLIVDLSFPNWKEVMELAVRDIRVSMIKLLPNYHMYEINEDNFEELIEITTKNKIVVSIQMRIEDKRGMYPLMKVPDLDIFKIVKTLSYFPNQVFMLNNIHKGRIGELGQVINSLNNVYVDIATLESRSILKYLYEKYTLEKFLFSTHAPFYYPEASLYKLKYADVDINEVEKVAYENGADLFKRFSNYDIVIQQM